MIHSFPRFISNTLIALFLFAGFAADGQTRPLKKDVCTALDAERAALAKKDIIDALLKGPEWSKANISADAMLRIRRYLEVEEQLRFRCRSMKVPLLAPEETETASVTSQKTVAQKKPAAKTKSAKPQPRPKLGAIMAPKPKLPGLTPPKKQVPAVALMPLPVKRPSPPVYRTSRPSAAKKKLRLEFSDNFGANPLLTND